MSPSRLTRRGFLGLLGAAGAGLVLDPERLLWVPGAKTIVVPPVTGWVTGEGSTTFTGGNTFLTIDMITREALRVLEQNLTLVTRINREYDDRWHSAGAAFSA